MIESDDIAGLLVPNPITDSVITALTANGVALPEDPSPAWVNNTSYGVGDVVHSPVTHRIYESLKASNQGHNPTDIRNQVNSQGEGTWWYDAGPTNRYAMFDGMTNTKTEADSPLVITLKPGAMNGYGLLGVDADGLEVVYKNATGGDVIHTITDDMEGSDPPDWYEWLFDRFKPRTQVITTDLEPYSSGEITITLTKVTGKVRLGMLAVGDVRPLGAPERDSSVEPRTYSYFGEDAFGNMKIRRRPSAVNITIPIKCDLEDADYVIDTIQEVLDVPVVVIGSRAQHHAKLSTFGLVSGRMSYADYPYRTLNLTVKGFT